MNGNGPREAGTWRRVPSDASRQAAPSDAAWQADSEWRPAPGEVHLWRASLDLPPERVRELERCLSPDELARAKRFVARSVRDRYTTARAVLRNILAQYVSETPADLHFSYTEYGKPDLVRPATSLRFNVSHSHDLAVYALTAGQPLGVDVEYLHRRAIVDRLKIAHRFFSDREYNALASLPSYRRDHAFLACWTRKEAFVKAIGQGLSCPLDQFDVTVDPNEPAELLATHWDVSDAQRWSMASFDPGPGYIGALAVKTRDVRLSFWQWDHEQFE